MNAIAIQWTAPQNELPEQAEGHLELLKDLLRDVKLERRMETLIEVENVTEQWSEGSCPSLMKTIRTNLEMDLMQIRKMIFLLEKVEQEFEA